MLRINFTLLNFVFFYHKRFIYLKNYYQKRIINLSNGISRTRKRVIIYSSKNKD